MKENKTILKRKESQSVELDMPRGEKPMKWKNYFPITVESTRTQEQKKEQNNQIQSRTRKISPKWEKPETVS